jgi:hypothetical protein
MLSLVYPGTMCALLCALCSESIPQQAMDQTGDKFIVAVKVLEAMPPASMRKTLLESIAWAGQNSHLMQVRYFHLILKPPTCII